MQVSSSPEPLPPARMTLGDSPWSGMSGGPVVAGGYLLAVVTEHAVRQGSSAITATPLTALEADPAHPGWGPGVAAPAAWWSRLGVGGAGDLQRLPVPPPPRPEPPYRATLREFGRALHRRMPLLVGRQQELAEIAAFATGAEGYRWLVGGAFAGKTALLYEAVTAGLPDGVDVVCYFLSRRASDATGDRFLEAVVPQLAWLCDQDPPVASVDQYHALWEQAAARAARTGRHLLLVVDGLDEDLLPSGSPGVESLLPALAGTNAHVLVSTRPRHADDKVTLGPFEGAQELADMAKQEIYDLTHGDDPDLAVDILGVLTAAAGPLSLRDLLALRSDARTAPTAADTRHVRRLVEDRAARSLERVGPANGERYQFAHESLLAYAQADDDLNDPEYRHRIDQWADRWRDDGWPTPAGGMKGTPQYFLDTYPSTLTDDHQRLAELAGDIGWVEAAVQSAGVDRVLTDLRQALTVNPASARVAAVLAAVTGQAQHLRPPQPVDEPGYILRQLCIQAADIAEDQLADDLLRRLQSRPGPCLMPRWTTRRAGRALSGELGRHDHGVWAVAVLADGRVATGGDDWRVLVWDPARPGANSAELEGFRSQGHAVAALPDGRVVTGGRYAALLVWDPAHPGGEVVELGHRGGYSVGAAAALPDGRVVTGGRSGRVLVWDPARPDADPVELGQHPGPVGAVAVLADGRVATAGDYPRVFVWDLARPGADPVGLDGPRRPVRAVAGLADGRLVAGGDDGRVLVWDPARPRAEPVELSRDDTGMGAMPVCAVAGLADGRLVAGGDDRRVLVWDPARPRAEPVELGRHDSAVLAVGVLADGRVVTGGNDKRVLVWNPAYPSVGRAAPRRYDGEVRAAAVLADGRLIIRDRYARVLLWDPAHPDTDPAELGRHNSDTLRMTAAAMAALADGRVVTGGADGRVLIWNPDHPGADPAELGRHRDAVLAVAVLADGRVITGGDKGQVLVWDPADSDGEVLELGRHCSFAEGAAVLTDGRVVTVGDGRVLVWDLDPPGADPAELGRHDSPALQVAALGDGRVVTGAEDGRVLIWDLDHPGADPTELGRHHDGRAELAIATLADGRVVTGSSDRRLVIWNPTDASTQMVHLGWPVTALAAAPFGPAETKLVVAYKPGGFSLWSYTM